MKRFFNLFLFSLLLIFPVSYAKQTLIIFVNNTPISSDVEPFIKNGTTFVPIRFIAEALNVEKITWNDSSKSVYIKNRSTSILLLVNQNYAYVNNEYKTLNNTALLVNSRTFVPLRFVSEILGANVVWNESNYTISISTTSNFPDTSTISPSINIPTKNSTNIPVSSNNKTSPNTLKASADSTTKQTDNSDINNVITNNIKPSPDIDMLANQATINIDAPNEQITTNTLDNDAIYWLSKIIEAEATGEPYIGKVAVGEVILNRVKSEDFPNTIWGVIFDDNFGIQFEPVKNGTIYNTPSEESINAAKDALSGSKNIGDCLYFLNPKIAKNPWIINNRQYYTTIANHDFYV